MTGKVRMHAYGESDPFRYGRTVSDTNVKQAVDRLKNAVEELDGLVVFDTLVVTVEYNICEMTEHVLATVSVDVDA